MLAYMIQELFNYYLEHQDELVKKFDGKYLIITADGVKGAYDTLQEGYDVALSEYGKGKFMLQLCSKGDEAYSQQFFTSRVAF